MHKPLTKVEVIPRDNESYIADVLKSAALAAIIIIALRMYPLKSGLIFSVLARRMRATTYKRHTLVSIDGLSPSIWSVRIPHKRTVVR